jgi:hypothetical protein
VQWPLIAMKIPALSALFLGLAVSLVSAAPEKKESTERISYTGTGKKAISRIVALEDWMELASPTPCSHGREYIEVDDKSPAFSRLRIEAVTGRPIIRSVRVQYTDGTERTVRIDQVIDAKRPAYVELRGTPLERVVVVSEGSAKTTYAVSAAPVRDHVARR